MATLLISCGGTQQVVPAAAPIGHGTIIGYIQTDGEHVTDITLHNAAADDPCSPCMSLGFAHAGDRVDILERRANGAIKVRTSKGIEGWMDSEFVKNE
jgi:hypothetical protein